MFNETNNSFSDDYEVSANFTNNRTEIEFYRTLILLVNICHMLIAVTIVIYQGISWILIPKWRNYKNYVFLNVCLAASIENCSKYAIPSFSYFIVMQFAVMAHNNWLLILSYMFYSSLVKVFEPNTNMFIRTAVIAWGIPILLSMINVILYLQNLNYALDLFIRTTIIFHAFLLPFLSFSMYILVLWHLLKNSNVRRSRGNTSSKIQVATLLLFMGVCMCLDYIIFFIALLDFGQQGRDLLVLLLFYNCITLTEDLIVAIWVCVAKANRTIWRNYSQNRKRINNLEEIGLGEPV